MASTINATTSSGIVATADNTGTLQLQSAGTTSATFNTFGIGLGSATPSSGIGITFPATQSASSDANTLDDYEEGTWTPSYTLDSGSVSGVASAGTYIKIGRQVSLTLVIYFATSSSGVIDNITNYPFTAQNANQMGVGSARENSNTGNQWHWRANSNDNRGLLRRYDNNAAIASGMTFIGTLTYFTA